MPRLKEWLLWFEVEKEKCGFSAGGLWRSSISLSICPRHFFWRELCGLLHIQPSPFGVSVQLLDV